MVKPRTHILLIDKDPLIWKLLEEFLPADEFRLTALADSEESLEVVESDPAAIVLLDLDTPGETWTDLLRRIKAADRETAVIATALNQNPERVVQALDLGAEDFIAKPFDPALIEISMRNIRERRTLRDQVTRLKTELERDHAFGMLIGETQQLVELREFIDQVANSELNILIRGESGTGKDVTARLIHQLSPRRDGPFVKVNCAALPENLIESELFGYEKGAFTGAVRAKPGRFQLAHGGTIFLDEITEIPYPLQSKLLQVLEQREFVSVGGTRTIRVDCRCIAATNVNIETWMGQQKFRKDLFFRLNEFSVALPPLRDRKQDIPLLVDYFLSLYSDRYQRKRRGLSKETIEQMLEYPWPGNIRELESLLKRVIVLDSEEVIFQTIGTKQGLIHSSPETRPIDRQPSRQEPGVVGPYDLTLSRLPHRTPREEPVFEPDGFDVGPVEESGTIEGGLKRIVEEAVERAEKRAILEVLQRTKWNRRKAAKQLGISYSSLLRRIDRYSLGVD